MAATDSTFRLFVAVQAPDAVKEALRRAQEQLRALLPADGARWTRPEQIHLTLRFLGDVPVGKVEALTQAVRQACAAFSPMLLRAAGIGFFPPKKLPRVIWAGIGGEGLSALAEAIQKATAPFTSEPAEKEFRGHLTLGRCKAITREQAWALAQFAREIGDGDFGSWTADAVALVRSEPSSAGHRHAELAQLPLCGKSL